MEKKMKYIYYIYLCNTHTHIYVTEALYCSQKPMQHFKLTILEF